LPARSAGVQTAFKECGMYKFSQVYDLSRQLLAAKCFKKWSDHYQSK